MWAAPRSSKEKGTDFPLESPEEADSCPHLDLGSGILIRDFLLPNLGEDNVCCFKLLTSCQCVAVATGNEHKRCWGAGPVMREEATELSGTTSASTGYNGLQTHQEVALNSLFPSEKMELVVVQSTRQNGFGLKGLSWTWGFVWVKLDFKMVVGFFFLI